MAYKISNELINYILDQKKQNPALSCRKISGLIEKRFQTHLSKSSINGIIKSAGLSLPAGRRSDQSQTLPTIEPNPVAKQGPAPSVIPAPVKIELPIIETVTSPVVPEMIAATSPVATEMDMVVEGETLAGAVFEKVADCILGGSYVFNTLIEDKLQKTQEHEFTEALLYLELFQGDIENMRKLWPLIGKRISIDEIRSFLGLVQAEDVAREIKRAVSSLIRDALCFKVELTDGNILYIDGQFRTVWSSQYLPANFATSIYCAKSYINKYFYDKSTLVLFMAPGLEFASNDFFDFIEAMNGVKKIARISIYGASMEDIRAFPFDDRQTGVPFIFGLWPWQYTDYRIVKKLGDFQPFLFEPLQIQYLLAPVEVELFQPHGKKQLSFSGVVLKLASTGKICMIILSNLAYDKIRVDELARMYLDRWPNLIESYKDFNRKLESFTYLGISQPMIDLKKMEAETDIIRILQEYRNILDIYVVRSFFSAAFENVEISDIKEHFFNLKCDLIKKTGFISVSFKIAAGSSQRSDLEYICCRLNEQKIVFYGTIPVWFNICEQV